MEPCERRRRGARGECWVMRPRARQRRAACAGSRRAGHARLDVGDAVKVAEGRLREREHARSVEVAFCRDRRHREGIGRKRMAVPGAGRTQHAAARPLEGLARSPHARHHRRCAAATPITAIRQGGTWCWQLRRRLCRRQPVLVHGRRRLRAPPLGDETRMDGRRDRRLRGVALFARWGSVCRTGESGHLAGERA